MAVILRYFSEFDSIVLHNGLDGRVHIKTRFDGYVGSVDA